MAKKSTKLAHENWLTIADQDLYAAAKLLKDDDITLAASTYYTQQCAEKALKAFLAFHNCPIRKTHDLIELIKDCCEFDQEFSQLIATATDLNPFATDSRYPDDQMFLPYQPQVEHALKQAADIISFVKKKIDTTRAA